MALQKFWTGSQGPFVYDDQKSYEDGVPFQAFRGGNESFQSFGGTAVFGGSITVGSYGVGDRIIELQHDTGNAATGGAHLVEFVGDIGGGNYSSFAFSLDPDNSTATIASAGYGTKNAEPIHIYVGGNRVAKFDNDSNLTRINAPDGTLGLDIAQGGPMIMRYAGGVRMKTTSTGIEINLPSTTDPAATLNFNVVDSGDGAHIQREGSTHIDLQSDGSTRVSGFLTVDGGVLTIDSGASLGRIAAPNSNIAIEIASSSYTHLRHNGAERFTTTTTGVEIVLPSTTAVAATLNFNVVDSADDAHIQLENITYLDLKSEGPLGVNGRRIEDVTDPTNLQDAATKNYVDNIATVSVLNDLTDVNTGVNTDGDILHYDGLNNEWIGNSNLPGLTLHDNLELTVSADIDFLSSGVIRDGGAAVLTISTPTMLCSVELDMQSNQITDMAEPTAASHAATKNYVDNNTGGSYTDADAIAAVEGASNLVLSDVNALQHGGSTKIVLEPAGVELVGDIRLLTGSGPILQGAGTTGATEAGWFSVNQGGDINYIRLYNTK